MLPPVVVGFLFLFAVLGALGVMAYIAYKGSKPSEFFAEVVQDEYQLEMAHTEIDAFYELKDALQNEFAPESFDEPAPVAAEEGSPPAPNWLQKVPLDRKNELKKALVLRLLACLSRLEQIQRDKPGQWKLWNSKLVSEKRWSSVCEAETLVGQEIDGCIAEAEEIEPGWKDSIFGEALHLYRLSKQHEAQKMHEKQERKDEKKAVQKTVKEKEMDRRKELEEWVKKEKAAQKAMEQLLAEEEKAAKAQKKEKGSKTATTVAPTSAGKAKGKKK